MIKEFPIFSKITLRLEDEIRKITRRYLPYSDYDFTTLWCWDIQEKRKVAILNNNLIIAFTDYISGDQFYSFFGENKLDKTITTLFNYTRSKNIETGLRFIPEGCIKNLKKNEKIVIVEDPNNHDYIYSIDKLIKYEGSEYAQARNLISRFTRKNDHIVVKKLDLANEVSRSLILKVNKDWQDNKGGYIKAEEKALHRLLKHAHHFNFDTIGVFVDKKIVAYAISEVLYNSYAISHFAQANTKYAGIYSFLMREIARSLQIKGCKMLNYEQDLGLPRLRQGKMSYRPVSFLKKFSIVLPE